jgi:hypothetical protein
MRRTLCGNRARRSLGVFFCRNHVYGGKRWSRALPTLHSRAACDCKIFGCTIFLSSVRSTRLRGDPGFLEMPTLRFAGHRYRLDRRPFITHRGGDFGMDLPKIL